LIDHPALVLQKLWPKTILAKNIFSFFPKFLVFARLKQGLVREGGGLKGTFRAQLIRE